MNEKYRNTFATWEVTTEGDVEGRSIKNLGIFTGHVDEIALHLADMCFYSLSFKLVEPTKEFTPKKDSVNVMFDINSDTWNYIKTESGLNNIKHTFRDRPVNIKPSCYFASFTIESTNYNEIKKKEALSKLTEEEKVLLGLKTQ